jgi:O-antigen ligase
MAVLATIQILYTTKPKRFLTNSVITLWFMITPVVNSRVFRMINPLKPITGRSWRIDFHLGLFFLAIIIIKFLIDKNARILNIGKLKYERYLYLYYYLSIIILFIHFFAGNILPEYIGIRQYINYMALLLYFVLVRFIDEDSIECILKSVMFMAITSTVFCLLQFFVDRWIMRTDRMAFAFSDYRRSSGIFQTPHDHALFAGSAIFFAYFTIKQKYLRLSVLAFLFFGLLLTFSRASWMGIFFTILLYFYTYHKDHIKKNATKYIFGALIFGLILTTYFPDFFSKMSETDVVKQRIASDTATQRFGLWHIGLGVLSENWVIGLGDKIKNDTYYKLMYEIGGKEWALGQGGSTHNLLIEELVFKGLFVSLALLLYFFNLYKYLWIFNKGRDPNYLILIIFYYAISFLIFMQFAGSFVNAYTGILLMVFTAIVSSVHHNKLDISRYTLTPDFFKSDGK